MRQAALDDSTLWAALESAATEIDPRDALAYEVAATRLAVELMPDIQDLARRRLAAPGGGEATRFLLLICGVIACRRMHDRVTARTLIDATRDEFREIPLYWHFRALTYLLHGSATDLRDGLEAAEIAHDDLPDNPGVLHTLACFHADLIETGRAPTSHDLAEPLELVDKAISLAERASPEVRALYRGRFYYTRARFLRRLERYDDARSDLLKAIELENRASADHAQRIADYLVELALIDADRSLTRLASKHGMFEERLVETAQRLEGAELRVISVVAFVTGLLAIVQVSVGTIGAGRPFWQVLAIICLLAVVLLSAVAAGSYFMHRYRPPLKQSV